MKSKIFLFLFLLPFSSLLAQQTYSIDDAIRKNLVSVIITGVKSDLSKSEGSTHYKDCLMAQIVNKTNAALVIDFETGRLLPSFDTSVQTMLLTNRAKVLVQPGKSRKVRLFAMCSQKHKGAPNEKKSFRIGTMAHDGLVALAKFIEKKGYQNQTGQNAVWAITDNNDITDMSKGSIMEKELFAFVQKVKNIGTIPNQTFKVQFIKDFNQQGFISVKVFNDKGIMVKTLAQDKTSSIGQNMFEFWVNDNELGKGKYKAVLFINGVANEQRDFEF